MDKNLDIITFAVSLIFKAVVIAAQAEKVSRYINNSMKITRLQVYRL